ncbi:unnamed protein product [Sphagnum compactum]
MTNNHTWHMGFFVLESVIWLSLDNSRNDLKDNSKYPQYTFLYNATSAPLMSEYDYIIVGGGAAGCPLAATLSQNYSVLLLERGGSPYGDPMISEQINMATDLLREGPLSPSQAFTSEDGILNHRARVLGGGTCLNAGFFTHASRAFVRAAGWDEGLVHEAYLWVEGLITSFPQLGPWQTAVKNGLLEVGVTPDNGDSLEHVYGTKIGGSLFDRNGHRHTAANLLEYADPNNLRVLLFATAHRILTHTASNGSAQAFGVLYTDLNGVEHQANLTQRAGSEVIVAAGALGSPHLLMWSGIGPAEQLTALNIPVVIDQPNVGQGMRDNPMNALGIPLTQPIEYSALQVVGIPQTFGGFVESASMNAASSISLQVPTALVSPCNMSTISLNFDTVTNFAALLQKVAGPVSSGELKLNGSEFSTTPSVRFNYYSDAEDLRSCVAGTKTMLDVLYSRALAPFVTDAICLPAVLEFLYGLSPNVRNDDAQLSSYCKRTVRTMWHYHGGCVVGKVVDADYRVLGTNALRVIDGSTFVNSPGTNPQATVMMLGRYMGVQILRERLSTGQH